MAGRKTTAKKKTPGRAALAWLRFRRSKPGRVIILTLLFLSLIALFAWIAGSDLSLFLLLTGCLLLLVNILAWFIYLTIREHPSTPAAKKRAPRKQTAR